jgi:ABC-type oligopeptide transport system substrate-binding subunit
VSTTRTATSCRAALLALSIAGATVGLAACGGSSSSGTATPKSSPIPNGAKSFEKVTPKQAKKLETSLATLHGVQSVTYYKNTHELQVYFHSATSSDQQTVTNLVKEH